ncbi:FecR domain-containing protein [Limnohabitans sp.]|uniref:FecR domain-containing protein n=1 Tax=Limnohabitans sp. TaxID=1907725 RepID=UPI00286F9C64|nr:FecR domain-containing protein [Limnohabitans sp.]
MKKQMRKQASNGLLWVFLAGGLSGSVGVWAGSVSVSPLVRLPAPTETVQPAPPPTVVMHTQSRETDERVVVKDGEHLMELAQRYLNKPQMWREWARYNGLGSADQIRDGQVLLLPQAWLRTKTSAATVSASTGSVSWIHPKTGKVLREVKLGDEVYPGMVLVAGERSTATLDLGTGVRVMVQSDTQMGLKEWRLLATGRLDALLDVPKGRVVVTTPSLAASQSSGEAVVSASAPSGAATDVPPMRRIRVKTPSAVLAVRGTTFEAEVTQKETLLSTQTGMVSMTSEGQTLQVPAGSGAKAVQGMKLPMEPEMLPLAPITAQLPVQVQQLPLQFDLSTTGVSRWRAVVARDAAMTQVLSAQEGQKSKLVDWVSLPNARYVMQLQGISANGLAGLPTLHAFEVAVPRMQMGPLRWLSVSWLNKQGGFKLDMPLAPDGQRWLVQLSLDQAVEKTVWQTSSGGGELTVPSGVAAKGAYLGVWLVAQQQGS